MENSSGAAEVGEGGEGGGEGGSDKEVEHEFLLCPAGHGAASDRAPHSTRTASYPPPTTCPLAGVLWRCDEVSHRSPGLPVLLDQSSDSDDQARVAA